MYTWVPASVRTVRSTRFISRRLAAALPLERSPEHHIMTKDAAIALIKEALHEISPARAKEFDVTNLDLKIRDIGIDSVAAMEMVGVVEEKLEVTFPDEDLAQLRRFSDLVDLITNNA